MIVDTAETLAVGTNEVYFEFATLFTIRFVVGLRAVVVIIGPLLGLISVLLTVGLFVLLLLLVVAVGLLDGLFSSVLLVQVKECAAIST